MDFVCARITKATGDSLGSSKYFVERAAIFAAGQRVDQPVGSFSTVSEAMSAVAGAVGLGTLIRWQLDPTSQGVEAWNGVINI